MTSSGNHLQVGTAALAEQFHIKAVREATHSGSSAEVGNGTTHHFPALVACSCPQLCVRLFWEGNKCVCLQWAQYLLHWGQQGSYRPEERWKAAICSYQGCCSDPAQRSASCSCPLSGIFHTLDFLFLELQTAATTEEAGIGHRCPPMAQMVRGLFT